MNYDGWVRGYRVQIRDWYDGKHIYLNMQGFKPGSSIERKPDEELSVLIDREDEQVLYDHLDSVVFNLMELRGPEYYRKKKRE